MPVKRETKIDSLVAVVMMVAERACLDWLSKRRGRNMTLMEVEVFV